MIGCGAVLLSSHARRGANMRDTVVAPAWSIFVFWATWASCAATVARYASRSASLIEERFSASVDAMAASASIFCRRCASKKARSRFRFSSAAAAAAVATVAGAVAGAAGAGAALRRGATREARLVVAVCCLLQQREPRTAMATAASR